MNRLGTRKPEIYGSTSMAQILLAIQQNWPEVRLEYRQSNHEGDLIDWIQDFEGDGIVLNAGGYSHTSVALRDAGDDAVEDCAVPVVEVHISDISQREPFRRTSLLTEVCAHSIIGKGINGYEQAVNWLIDTAQH